MRTVRVSSATRPATEVSWFPGSSSESIELTVKAALGMPPDAVIRVIDQSNGCLVGLTEWVPEGLEFHVEAIDDRKVEVKTAQHESRPLLERSDDEPTKIAGDAFRGQLLKFERINAHLANERTWLAWVRTALSLVSCAFTLLNEAYSDGNQSWRITYFVIGCLFVGCVDLTWLTGWFRYRRIKDILAMPKDAIPEKFNRVRVRFQAHFLGLLLTSTVVIYIASGWRAVR
ncbi:hypothetical protein CTAYLR_000786 [Chrysophaeum taylorii]|uniref:DUF202 domain-containing protein n=1 Tax=Chrysophaeum taylorii TaxID=2483200 RepID=A0AAD7UQC9_9STRA|nr:hypothetical protein CTAYLR_000786 [Chrysophaeum taylorii]